MKMQSRPIPCKYLYDLNCTYSSCMINVFSLFVGVPLIIVILTLSINKTDNYGLQPGGM